MEPLDAVWIIAAVSVVFGALYLAVRNEVTSRNVVCPRTGKTAAVDVVRRFESKRPVRIRACSLFDDPRKVTCAQDCLTHMTRG